MNIQSRAFKNFVSLLVGQVISRIFTFFVVIYLARVLGAANFGKIGFAQTILAYFGVIANLGTMTIGTREIAQNRERINEYVNTITSLRLMLATLSFLSLLIFVALIPKPTEIRHLIILYGLSLFPFSLLLEWLFQGIETMEFISLSRILSQFFYFALVFLLVKNAGQLQVVPVSWLIGNLIACGFLLYIFNKRSNKIKLEIDFLFWKKFLKHAIPIGISLILVQIYHGFDIIMLGFLKGDKAVGVYNAPWKLFSLAMQGGGLVTVVAFPMLSSYYRGNQDDFRNVWNRYRNISFFFGAMGLIVGTFFAEPIILFLYGREYIGSIWPFRILSWAFAVLCINGPYGQPLLVAKYEKTILLITLITAITNVLANIVMVPHWGAVGAAIAYFITQVMATSWVIFYFYRKAILPKELSYTKNRGF